MRIALLRIGRALAAILIAAPIDCIATGATAVVTRNVNLRNDPSTSQPPKTLLKPPTSLELLSDTPQAGYYHVELADGTKGWVWLKNVQVSETGAVAPSASIATSISLSWSKPPPVSGDFTSETEECGPNGDGGDVATNVRKNRTDIPSSYHDVTFHAIASLQYPVAGKTRDTWQPAQLAEIAKVEGVPVRVVGYLVALKPQTGGSGESTNCHWKHAAQVDWHVALVEQQGQGEKEAVVVETTPRIRRDHPKWIASKLRDWVDSDQPVRISGWLLLDPEHRNHLGSYRETLWEVHPITEIEVQQDGQWVKLDDID